MSSAFRIAGGEKMPHRMGTVAVAVFAFGALGGTALANLGLLLLLIATLLAPASLLEWGRRCRVTALLSAIFALLVVFATARGTLTTPVPWALQREGAVDLLILLLFPLVAVWTAGDERRILWALGLGLAGVFVGRLMDLDAASWQALMQGRRTGIDLSPLALNEYVASGLVGLITLAPVLWRHVFRGATWLGIVGVLLWLVSLALCGYLTVVGRTRGVWLSLAIVAFLLLLWELSYLWRQRCRSWRAWAGVGMVVVLIMAGTAAAWPIVEKRLSREVQTLEHLMEGEFAAIAATHSIGARLHMWQFGLQKTLQRPWLGWGAGGSDYLLGHSGNPKLIRFEDFHSAAVDLPVRLGIPATLAFGLLCVSLFWIPLQARDANRHVVQTLIALLLLHLLTQATNFRMLNTDWRLWWLLIAGLCAGYALRRVPSTAGVREPGTTAQRARDDDRSDT